MKRVLVDANFWIGLTDKREKHHASAESFFEEMVRRRDPVVLPWPCVYEVFRSRSVKSSDIFLAFDAALRALSHASVAGCEKIGDEQYRTGAWLNYDEMQIRKQWRKLSFVDLVLRQMLVDDALDIGVLVTADVGDFQDICVKRRIRLTDWTVEHG